MENLALYKSLTKEGKVVSVNDMLGNTDIKNQQGTSRTLVDSLAADATTTLQFFQNVQTRAFPFTNLNENKLQDGEAMVVKRIYFGITPTTAGAITDLTTFEEAALPQLYCSTFSLFIDTKQVIKDYCLSAQCSKFNKYASYANNEVITFDNNIVIPPNKQWRIELRTPAYVAVSGGFFRCTIEGYGTLWNPGQQL